MAESPNFCGALSLLVNHLAAGEAPSFLQRFLAGGVSIALSKGALAVRPLCCGDPFRRLVPNVSVFWGRTTFRRSSKAATMGSGAQAEWRSWPIP